MQTVRFPQLARRALLLLAASAALSVSAQVNDGPYIKRTATGVEAQWVCSDAVVKVTYAAGQPIEPVCGHDRAITLLPAYTAPDSQASFTASKIAAISDFHGQFDLAMKVLQKNGVINGQREWAFGTGHLVVVGDLLDRGPKHTEAMWWAYTLQQQAQAAGGRVHVLLGNHELMVMQNDLRYLNSKYVTVATKLGTTYNKLLGADTVLGNWLRTRPVMVRINDTLFVHAGVSKELVALKMSAQAINETFSKSIGKSSSSRSSTETLLQKTNGVVWYRGFFESPLATQAQVDQAAQAFGASRIVVGHTSFSSVQTKFGGKVIGIDASIKNGSTGQMIFVEDGTVRVGARP